MAKSKKKARLPKRIAGVKIPRKVRKGDLSGVFASPAGRLIVGELAVIAAAALAGRGADRDSAIGRLARHPIDALRGAGEDTIHGGETAGRAVGEAGSGLAFAVSEGMRAFTAALDQVRDEAVNAGAKGEVAKKKPRPAASPSAH